MSAKSLTLQGSSKSQWSSLNTSYQAWHTYLSDPDMGILKVLAPMIVSHIPNHSFMPATCITIWIWCQTRVFQGAFWDMAVTIYFDANFPWAFRPVNPMPHRPFFLHVTKIKVTLFEHRINPTNLKIRNIIWIQEN